MDNDNPLKGNFLLIASWFGASFTAFTFAVFFLFYLSITNITLPKATTYQLYQALPPSSIETQDGVVSSDGRIKAVANFFKGYNAVLANYAETFIVVADKYKLDWRLMPAIAMQESNGGRRVITDSHNAFGFGIYGSKVTKFDTWEQGIETVGKGLKENYIDKGLTTPETIMTKYTPPSVALGGPWAIGVRTFMEELR